VKTHRPIDPFATSKPRPAETVKAHQTTPQDLQRLGAARPVRAPEPTPAPAAQEKPVLPPMDQKERALHLVGVEGLSYAKAAAAVKRPLATVFGWCKKEGVKPGSRKPATRGGEITVRGLGEPRTVAFAEGDTPATVAGKLKEAIDAQPPGPVTVSSPAKMPEGVELQPVVVRARPEPAAVEFAAPPSSAVCRNCGDRFDGPERDCPNPSPGKPYVDCGRGGHWFEEPEDDEPEGTARRGQLEPPEVPEPRHVEVYVGPPRGAQVERLDACIVAALAALREGIKGSDWACVRVAAAILNETGGAS
jgi:hypothetical protein